MAPGSQRVYVLHGGLRHTLESIPEADTIIRSVSSANMTVARLNLPTKKCPNLYVEIRLEESAVQWTKVIKRKTTPIWNEEFHMCV